MPYEIYKIIHLTGVLMVFLSLGGLIARSVLGVEGTGLRKIAGMTNGLGMVMALVGGFGLLARLGAETTQLWVLGKILIWILFGGAIAVANRKPEFGISLWFALILLGMTAAYLAGFKPA